MAALAPDPVAFRTLEHAGWQGAARYYDDAFGSLTRQAVDPLLDAAQVRSGARTLDVASGPGYAAAAAAGAAVFPLQRRERVRQGPEDRGLQERGRAKGPAGLALQRVRAALRGVPLRFRPYAGTAACPVRCGSRGDPRCGRQSRRRI